MPYSSIEKKVKDGKERWCFKNKETGEERCSDSKSKAIAAMRLLYGIEGGMKPRKSKS